MLLTDCLLRSTRGALAARGSRRESVLEDHSGEVPAQPLNTRTTALAINKSEWRIILEAIFPGPHDRQNLGRSFEVLPNLCTRCRNHRGLITAHEWIHPLLMLNRGG